MTDSFSDDKPLSPSELMMAKDLMESKIAEAKANSKMTHLLMFGNFRMEIVPTADMDVEKIFKNTLTFLHDKYGDGILKTDSPSGPALPMGGMHG
jgi:hypothetical protein